MQNFERDENDRTSTTDKPENAEDADKTADGEASGDSSVLCELLVQMSSDVISAAGGNLPIIQPICNLLSFVIQVGASITDDTNTTDYQIMLLNAKLETLSTCNNIMRKIYFYKNECEKAKKRTQFKIRDIHETQVKRLAAELTSFFQTYIPEKEAETDDTWKSLWKQLTKAGVGMSISYAKPLIAERTRDLMECILTIEAESEIDLALLMGEDRNFHDRIIVEAAQMLRENLTTAINADVFDKMMSSTEKTNAAISVTMQPNATNVKSESELQQVQKQVEMLQSSVDISSETKTAVKELLDTSDIFKNYNKGQEEDTDFGKEGDTLSRLEFVGDEEAETTRGPVNLRPQLLPASNQRQQQRQLQQTQEEGDSDDEIEEGDSDDEYEEGEQPLTKSQRPPNLQQQQQQQPQPAKPQYQQQPTKRPGSFLQRLTNRGGGHYRNRRHAKTKRNLKKSTRKSIIFKKKKFTRHIIPKNNKFNIFKKLNYTFKKN